MNNILLFKSKNGNIHKKVNTKFLFLRNKMSAV